MTSSNIQVEHLSHGDVLVTTPGDRRVQFGLSADAVKDTMPAVGPDGKFVPGDMGRFPTLFVADPHTAFDFYTGQDRLFPEFLAYWPRWGHPYLVSPTFPKGQYTPGPVLPYNLAGTPEILGYVEAILDLSFRSLISETFRRAHPDFDFDRHFPGLNMPGELEYWGTDPAGQNETPILTARDLFTPHPFDESGRMVMGGLAVRSLGEGRYELVEEGNSLGEVDLVREYAALAADQAAAWKRLPELGSRALEVRRRLVQEGEPGWVMTGAGSGFTPGEAVSGGELFHDNRILLIDPPAGTNHAIETSGLDPAAVEGVVLTHTHEDHDQDVLRQLTQGRKRTLYTTRPIEMQFVEKLFHKFQGRLSREAIRRLWDFHELSTEELNRVIGLNMGNPTGFHSNAAFGIEISHEGEIVFSYSGDTNADPHVVAHLGQDRRGRLVMIPRRQLEVMHRPFLGALLGGVSVVERGGYPLHTPDGPLLEHQHIARYRRTGGHVLAYHNGRDVIHEDLARVGLGLEGAIMFRQRSGDPRENLDGTPDLTMGLTHGLPSAVPTSPDQVIDQALARRALFLGMSPAKRIELANHGELLTLQPGEDLVTAGDPMEALLIPLGGRVGIYNGAQTREGMVAPEILGVDALLEAGDVRWDQTFRAETPMDVVRLSLSEAVRGILASQESGDPSFVDRLTTLVERKTGDIGNALSQSPWFQGLDAAAQHLVLLRGRPVTIAAGHRVFGPHPNPGLGIVLSGTLAYRENERDLSTVGPGELVGDMEFVLRPERPLPVVAFAAEKAQVLHLDSDPVAELERFSSRATLLTLESGMRRVHILETVRGSELVPRSRAGRTSSRRPGR